MSCGASAGKRTEFVRVVSLNAVIMRFLALKVALPTNGYALADSHLEKFPGIDFEGLQNDKASKWYCEVCCVKVPGVSQPVAAY